MLGRALRRRWEAWRRRALEPLPPEPEAQRRRFWALSLLLFAAGLWFLFYGLSFNGLLHPDAMDCAQIARRLATGQGFTTSVIPPLALVFAPEVERAPVLHQAPFWPLWLVPWVREGGGGDAPVAMASGVFWWATVALLLALGYRLFGREPTLVGVAFFLLNRAVLERAIEGTPAMAAMFWWTLALGLVVWPEMASPWRCGLLGMALACGYLTEPRLAATLALFLLAFWMGQPRGSRWWAAGLTLLPVLLLVGPWWWRNWRWTGDPFFLLWNYDLVAFTRTFPGTRLYRTVDPTLPSPWRLMGNCWRDVVASYARGVGHLWGQLPLLSTVWVWSLVMPGWLQERGPEARRLWNLFWAAALLGWAGWAAGREPAAKAIVLVPLLSLWAGVCFWEWTKPFVPSPRRWLLWEQRRVLGLMALLGFALWLLAGFLYLQPPTPSVPQNDLALLRRTFPPSARFASDRPWWVAWYADRIAFWLPESPADLHLLDSLFGPLQGIYITRFAMGLPPWEDFANWGALVRSRQAPWGFRIDEAFREGVLYERWALEDARR